jgi:hypothetical protein
MALRRAAQIAIKHPAAMNGARSVSDAGAVVAVAFPFSFPHDPSSRNYSDVNRLTFFRQM